MQQPFPRVVVDDSVGGPREEGDVQDERCEEEKDWDHEPDEDENDRSGAHRHLREGTRAVEAFSAVT